MGAAPINLKRHIKKELNPRMNNTTPTGFSIPSDIKMGMKIFKYSHSGRKIVWSRVMAKALKDRILAEIEHLPESDQNRADVQSLLKSREFGPSYEDLADNVKYLQQRLDELQSDGSM